MTYRRGSRKTRRLFNQAVFDRIQVCDRKLASVSDQAPFEGWMNSAVARLLRALHEAGAQLAYHGDFDWAGMRIAAAVLGRFPARPWRFRAADYLAATAARPNGLPPLKGRPSPTPWDPALTEAMTAAGVVVEEEAVLAELLSDLGPAARSGPGS